MRTSKNFAALSCALAVLLSTLGANAQTQASEPRTSTVLVFDVSNSMWGQVEGRSKIEIGREVIEDLLLDWDPDANLGLVAYGHRRAGDCSDIEEVIPIGPVDARSFSDIVNGLVPRGKTPLTDAVRSAADILNYTDTPATVILVSDGIESCKADPCALAQELERGGIDFTAHVIGFDVARIEDQRQLSCLADETGGQYLTAQSAGELLSALRTVAAPPPPMLRLVAVAEAGGVAIDDPGLRWTVVALDREETILGGEAQARPELVVEGGSYFARAELGNRAGSVEFTYSGDEDALHQVMLTVSASLDGPAEAEAGTEFQVRWTGPDAAGDFISLADAGAPAIGFVSYARTSTGSPVTLAAPDAPGNYELRYIDAARGQVLADAPILISGASATLEAAPAVEAGSGFDVAWTGPGNPNDFITIVPIGEDEGKHGNYTYIREGSPLELDAPDEPGSYELRYVAQQSNQTLARLPIAVTEVAATLEAQPAAGAGSEIKVTWTGPDNHRDFITIVPVGEEEGKHGNYTYTTNGSPLKLRLPETAGSYELRYVTGQARRTLARLPIAVTQVSATLDAAPAIGAGSDIKVTWTGPDNHRDFITIVPVDEEEGKHGAYVYTNKGSPMKLRAPDVPGSYELRYVTAQSRETLARLPIAVTKVSATLDAAPAIGAGSDIKVTWTGPDNHRDFITIVPVDEEEGKHGAYVYTNKGSPMKLRAPDVPGSYELRYVTAQSRETLARLPIAVTAVSAMLEAQPSANAGAEIKVAWTGPDNHRDFITVVPVGEDEGKHGNYTYTNKGSPLKLRLPETPGSYELRYVTGQSRSTLATLPIAVAAVTATLEAAPVVAADGNIQIVWSGPDNHRDYIAIAKPSDPDGKYVAYTYTDRGSPLQVRAPREPGSYELRYVTAQDRNVLTRLPITVK